MVVLLGWQSFSDASLAEETELLWLRSRNSGL